MADIRINALATTAASTASDDFVAVDGSANGTRKLNAFSPTFGGNLTVSGLTTSAGVSNSGALTFTAAAGQIAGSIAKNATYGLTYYGITGSSNDNTMLNASGAVVLSNPAGTTNTTLAGNLTVSGTGNNLFNTGGGNFGIGAASPSGKLTVYGGQTEWGATSSLGFLGYTGGNPIVGSLGALSLLFYTNGAEAGRITSSGNVLIGTTTDSANGKLQLATHTTSAGGIGFGTDTSLYRSQTGMLALDGLTGSLSQLDLRVGGVQKAFVAWNGGDFYLGAVVGTTVIRSSNTTALTLDSSQRATFSTNLGGNGFSVNVNNAGGNTVFQMLAASSAAHLRVLTNGSLNFITGGSDQTLGTTALTLDSSQNAEFAGKITATSSSQGILSLTGSSNTGTNIRLKNTGTNGRDWGINSNVTLGQGEFSLYDYTAGYESFRITGTSTGTVTIYPTGGLVVENGPIKTAAPSGGTAATWRLGTVASVSPTSPNRTIEVEIGGTTYYIHAKTTNN